MIQQEVNIYARVQIGNIGSPTEQLRGAMKEIKGLRTKEEKHKGQLFKMTAEHPTK